LIPLNAASSLMMKLRLLMGHLASEQQSLF